MEFIALKRMKRQTGAKDPKTGRPIMETLQPGDVIPDAQSLPGLRQWINSGHIGVRGAAAVERTNLDRALNRDAAPGAAPRPRPARRRAAPPPEPTPDSGDAQGED